MFSHGGKQWLAMRVGVTSGKASCPAAGTPARPVCCLCPGYTRSDYAQQPQAWKPSASPNMSSFQAGHFTGASSYPFAQPGISARWTPNPTQPNPLPCMGGHRGTRGTDYMAPCQRSANHGLPWGLRPNGCHKLHRVSAGWNAHHST